LGHTPKEHLTTNAKQQESDVSDIISDGLDGFEEEDGRASLIKGIKIKFTKEAQWIMGEDDVIESDREFIVAQIIKGVQKWVDDRPVETIMLDATAKFPDIEKLNAEASPDEWRLKFDKNVGPWEATYIVYMVCADTWQIFTYPAPAATVGASQAVRDLREATRMARRIKGPGLYPKVRLADVFMNTKFGGRQRPCFDIVGYEALGAEQAVLTADQPKLIEAKPTESAEPAKLSARTAIKSSAKTSAKRPPASGKINPRAPARKDPDFDAV
jgi:hypothetical protein